MSYNEIPVHPDYATTCRIDELRASEYAYLDSDGQVYLDYAGGGVLARAQLEAHHARLSRSCYGNPHSENPTSRASAALVESARLAVLDHFHASPAEYAVIFTANATGACRLVGEAYPFGRGSRFILTFDNHNSVNGMREYARSHGATIEYVPVRPPHLRADPADLEQALRRAHDDRGLFAYPAQSNFSGVQHPLEWVELAHSYGYDVLLDAAAYAPTNELDLSAVKPDFVPISWYKLFGYPTGVGCLIARREALARLRRPWFAGGTIRAVSVQGDWFELMDDESGFEDGTLNYLSIPDVEFGLSWIDSIGVDVVHTRVRCLTDWLLRAMAQTRHAGGEPLFRVYGPPTAQHRGGTITFNLLDPYGVVVDERLVAVESSAAGVSLRTGCFCNPGAGEGAFELSRQAVRSAVVHGSIGTVDRYLDHLAMPTGGGVRVSFGLASSLGDARRFLDFAVATYADRGALAEGLAPRLRC
jgi:selenocysteine lyase/cysteine desulfurase